MTTTEQTSANWTSEQHIVMNTWAQQGAAAFVTKLQKGRGWIVDAHGVAFPVVFKTKREALAMADRGVHAFLGHCDHDYVLHANDIIRCARCGEMQ
jgi:predicted 3-demethylubiquinone-9 3-methyltransferase (glyoxalase superfamily)